MIVGLLSWCVGRCKVAGNSTTQIGYSMTNPKNNCSSVVAMSLEALTLVPLGEVEALPIVYPLKLRSMGGLC